MFEIKSKVVNIEGHPVELFKREVVSCNILEVTAGTNGFQGGDSGHGSRTFFRIRDLGGTDIQTKVLKDERGYDAGFQVVLGGDCELDTFVKSLKFAIKVLEDQIKEVND